MEAIPSIYETVSTLRPWQGMGDLAAAGFKRLLLDFSMFTSAELIRQKKHRPELVRELYGEFFSTAKKFKMEFPIAKLPFFSHFPVWKTCILSFCSSVWIALRPAKQRGAGRLLYSRCLSDWSMTGYGRKTESIIWRSVRRAGWLIQNFC